MHYFAVIPRRNDRLLLLIIISTVSVWMNVIHLDAGKRDPTSVRKAQTGVDEEVQAAVPMGSEDHQENHVQSTEENPMRRSGERFLQFCHVADEAADPEQAQEAEEFAQRQETRAQPEIFVACGRHQPQYTIDIIQPGLAIFHSWKDDTRSES